MSDAVFSPGRRSEPRNRLLGSLPADEQECLRPHLKRIHIEAKQVLFDPNKPITSIYFPEGAMVSLLSIMSDGTALEVATVGWEGMVGLPVFLDCGSMAAQAVVQVPGATLQMPAQAFREALDRCGSLDLRLNRYTQALVTMLAQSSGCNRAHPVHQRCSRWLLMVHDRVRRGSFPLTHLFLSQMLGVRRATVTQVLGDLQREGLITYNRGRMKIRSRAGLEAVSCDCYRIIASEFTRLLEGTDLPSPLDRVRTSDQGKTLVGDGTPDPVASAEA